jgi:hypothetical protein
MLSAEGFGWTLSLLTHTSGHHNLDATADEAPDQRGAYTRVAPLALPMIVSSLSLALHSAALSITKSTQLFILPAGLEFRN